MVVTARAAAASLTRNFRKRTKALRFRRDTGICEPRSAEWREFVPRNGEFTVWLPSLWRRPTRRVRRKALIHAAGMANRTATALQPHRNRITSALEPRRVPDGIQAWKSEPPEKPLSLCRRHAEEVMPR